MNTDNKAFISLISSFLNCRKPALAEIPNWQKIYKLADIHNVLAIIAYEITQLPDEYKPEKEILSRFKQQLGYTIIEFEKEQKAKHFITNVLKENEIEYMLLKGAVLNEYYPAPEFRTSGDIDVFVKSKDFEKCTAILNRYADDGTIIYSNTGHQYESAFYYEERLIELHGDIELTDSYFNTIFDLAERSGFEYKINDTLHLAYVISHIAGHLKYHGAGIRMCMDIDVLARRLNGNIGEALEICKSMGLSKLADVCLATCVSWFGTPVSTECRIKDNEHIRALFENEIIHSGTFGDANKTKTDFYAIGGFNTANSSKSGGLLYYLFPSIKQMSLRYKFLKEYRFLLPLAWLMRIFEGFFKRRRTSADAIKAIVNPNESIEEYIELLKGLDL